METRLAGLRRLADQALRGRDHVVLFLSASSGASRARTWSASGSFDAAWTAIVDQLSCGCSHEERRWLRIDWVESSQATTWGELRTRLAATKRNYFRQGISLDAEFRQAFLEVELNAHAMLYGGPDTVHAVVNEGNFLRPAKQRHGIDAIDFADDRPVWTFSSAGAFSDAASGTTHRLHGSGANAGRRAISHLDAGHVRQLIGEGSRYLASQVREDGRFHYGWHPSFDRPISAYNALRHASTLYAMLEASEVVRSDALDAAIGRSLDYLVTRLILPIEDMSGRELAFLVEENGEAKLGGAAVAILALAKHAELTGSEQHLGLMQALGEAILSLQHEDGRFDHVVLYPSLRVKEPYRIIYYDGEAAFALMRLYKLTGDSKWLASVALAFRRFIAKRQWQAHDHWLGYAADELSAVVDDPRIFDFGLRNIEDHLDFVLERQTTFPTLLELMLASERLVTRLAGTPHRAMLRRLDRHRFYRALHARANHLLNGHFWPELAMYFARPDKIAGSFFIRHHAFRVRIDDVEHYLSGFVAYLKYLERPASLAAWGGWTAAEAESDLLGEWQAQPDGAWAAKGLCIHASTFRPGQMVVVRTPGAEKGIRPQDLASLPGLPAALLTQAEFDLPLPHVPVIKVENSDEAVIAAGRQARERFQGKVIAVTGSAGKTTTVAMLARALAPYGETASSSHSANLPHGVAWNISCAPRTAAHLVLEVAVGRMLRSARLARPHIAIFTNLMPAHLTGGASLADIAKAKSRLFRGMMPGGIAILNSDMPYFDLVADAARARDLQLRTFGTGKDADIRLVDFDADQSRLSIDLDGRILTYRLPGLGHHHALDSIAALAAIDALGYEPAAAVEQLGAFSALPGRGRRIEVQHDAQLRFTILDEAYNANPGSMAAALSFLASQRPGGRRIAILGEMAELGEQSASFHTELAPLVERLEIDKAHVVGEQYRDFWSRLSPERRGLFARDRDELRGQLGQILRDGDVVLIKGSYATGLHRLVAELSR